ncbi:MAG: VWA domain-containing protein [Planctomycetota bacterium]
MGFISPLIAAIAAGITIPALVSLYFLKLKRKRMVIPSTLLWQRAVQDLQVNAPFQRIRNNLLLWIQLLLLIALLIAMARPTQHSFADPGRRVVIVIDVSASMSASDPALDGETRLDSAKARALKIIDSLADSNAEQGEDGAAGAMVVTFGHRAQVRQDFTTDLAKVRKAIRDIQPTDHRSFLDSAIATIEPFARQGASADNKLTVHVLTDGNILETTDQPLSLVNSELQYHRIGDPAASPNNLAIVAFNARRDFEKPQLVQVFARLANYGPEAVTTNLTLSLDGKSMRTQQVTVPPVKPATPDHPRGEPGQTNVSYDFVFGGMASIRVTHDHADLLDADDSARLVLAPSRELRVLLVTEGNNNIENAAKATGIENLVQMSPAKFEDQDPARLRRGGWDAAGVTGDTGAAGEGFDVIIFDRYAPQSVPLVNSLYFAATPPLEDLQRRATPDDAPANELITQWDRAHPLLSNVQLNDIPLRRPGRLVVPVDGRVLAVGREGPVMAEVRREGVRHVVVSFDLFESLWPHSVSFPVFMQNALPILGLDGATDSSGLAYRTGENATLMLDGEIDEVTYTGPARLTGRALGTSLTVESFPFVGLYGTKAAVDARYRELAVNLLDSNESNLRTAELLKIGTSSVAGQAQAVEVRKELWHWFAWGALALLVVEWLVYTRRMHI